MSSEPKKFCNVTENTFLSSYKKPMNFRPYQERSLDFSGEGESTFYYNNRYQKITIRTSFSRYSGRQYVIGYADTVFISSAFIHERMTPSKKTGQITGKLVQMATDNHKGQDVITANQDYLRIRVLLKKSASYSTHTLNNIEIPVSGSFFSPYKTILEVNGDGTLFLLIPKKNYDTLIHKTFGAVATLTSPFDMVVRS